MKDDLNSFLMEDNLTFFDNGRRPQVFQVKEYLISFCKCKMTRLQYFEENMDSAKGKSKYRKEFE